MAGIAVAGAGRQRAWAGDDVKTQRGMRISQFSLPSAGGLGSPLVEERYLKCSGAIPEAKIRLKKMPSWFGRPCPFGKRPSAPS